MRMPKTGVPASSRERLREAAKSLFAKQGYESTTTAAICRLAGTSQSQLIKHFTNKNGILEAVFEHAWEQLNPAIHLAIEKVSSPREKLRILTDMMLTLFESDPELRILFLLEGRRIRGDGHMVKFVPGFLEFVKTLDSVFQEMAARAELAADVHPQCLRSGLMGAFEGLLRDQLLARPSRFPASYSEANFRAVFYRFLSSCLVT